ncbi:hypothetical protein B9G69_006795 [Bdellovibrio sp. SKB1291214]|uniref:hypothetical protein n=1 Tax=Bdellovibrio sp. SKB1291214 TaxID=1732569 RepID=UPI000B51B858|nr:hypothetical protein [Bdellovibrio sp. SKB1291214]UYL10285.1 hypothetical protein B9G69_006795 [Bdellovibrio sp. SKB1291214]
MKQVAVTQKIKNDIRRDVISIVGDLPGVKEFVDGMIDSFPNNLYLKNDMDIKLVRNSLRAALKALARIDSTRNGPSIVPIASQIQWAAEDKSQIKLNDAKKLLSEMLDISEDRLKTQGKVLKKIVIRSDVNIELAYVRHIAIFFLNIGKKPTTGKRKRGYSKRSLFDRVCDSVEFHLGVKFGPTARIQATQEIKGAF